ncbi:MAG TPA: cytochrome b/b6 domain-containing protein [Gemmatimonadaceae bacterium]
MHRPRNHIIVRITHWVNVVALTIMIGSGLRIFNAYPAFARRGETFCCYPFEGKRIPGVLTFGGWLAGARNWHFAMMWLLVLNGVVYLGYTYMFGNWRDLVPRRGFFRDVWEMMRFYLWLRPRHPVQGKFNALQRGTYFVLPIIGIVAVVSGIAIWKPVQLAWLTNLLGGYVWARYWHFLAMLALVVLSMIHIFMIFATDPYSLRAMTTGGYNPRNSPEARNARPFYHLLPQPEAHDPISDYPQLDETTAYPAPGQRQHPKLDLTSAYRTPSREVPAAQPAPAETPSDESSSEEER